MNDLTPRIRSAIPSLGVSLVVPIFNEREVLPEFHSRASAVLSSLGLNYEIVYVNDGSRDASLEVLRGLRNADPHVTVVDLSRNFGKEIALTAGLDHSKGEAVIVIDADLQDPPELIPEMVATWQEGYDVVYAVRTIRDGETWLKKATANAFYRLIARASRVPIPRNTGDFRLLSRRAVNALLTLREHHRFMKGLFAWIGFRSKGIPYKRDPRLAGRTSFNYFKLWNLAVEGFTSFTIAPLKIATYLGLAIAAFAFTYAIYIIFKTLVYGDPVAGYPSLMVVVLMLGGIQLVGIGIIGEYLGRVFNEVKHRPLYLVQETIASELQEEQRSSPLRKQAAGRSGVGS
jgi:polyisoprenyl-phosphate glycosyltransferase